MFLSKVKLNPRHRRTYALLADLYAQHRFVLSAFPDREEGEMAGGQAAHGVLYRLEAMEKEDVFFFLVQSRAEPDWEKAQDLHPDMVCTACSKEWNPTFATGERYRFRLRASPTVCKVNRDAAGVTHPKREGLFREDEQQDWLERTAERCGFAVVPENVLVTPRGKKEGRQTATEGGKGNAITCFTVDYDGLLRVMDAVKFTDALVSGVGRGKAWGCGLLSVARA